MENNPVHWDGRLCHTDHRRFEFRYVPWFFDVFFQIPSVVTKSCTGFPTCGFPCQLKVFWFPRSHSYSASGCRFQDNRITNLLGDLQSGFQIPAKPSLPGMVIYSALFMVSFGVWFITHLINLLWWHRSSHRVRHRSRFNFEFSKENHIRMYCVSIGDFRCSHDAGNVQIWIRLGGGPDTHGFVCETNVQTLSVSGAVCCHRNEYPFPYRYG